MRVQRRERLSGRTGKAHKYVGEFTRQTLLTARSGHYLNYLLLPFSRLTVPWSQLELSVSLLFSKGINYSINYRGLD